MLTECQFSGTSSQVNQTYKTNSKSHGYEDTFFRYSFGKVSNSSFHVLKDIILSENVFHENAAMPMSELRMYCGVIS